MTDIQEVLKSRKIEKDALLVDKKKGVTGDNGIAMEFNIRRLNREMKQLCTEYDDYVAQNNIIEEKLSKLETDPPR